MASILWLWMGERSAKTNVKFHSDVIGLIGLDNFACPCYPLVNSNNMSMSCPTILDRQAISFPLETDHFQHFCHGFFWVLNFETTQLQFRALFFVEIGWIISI